MSHYSWYMSDTAKAGRSTSDPRRQTRQVISDLIAANPNIAVRDISRALDLSTQRVYQHTKALGLKQTPYGTWVSNGKEGSGGVDTATA